jgi:hypothetical protein
MRSNPNKSSRAFFFALLSFLRSLGYNFFYWDFAHLKYICIYISLAIIHLFRSFWHFKNILFYFSGKQSYSELGLYLGFALEIQLSCCCTLIIDFSTQLGSIMYGLKWQLLSPEVHRAHIHFQHDSIGEGGSTNQISPFGIHAHFMNDHMDFFKKVYL